MPCVQKQEQNLTGAYTVCSQAPLPRASVHEHRGTNVYEAIRCVDTLRKRVFLSVPSFLLFFIINLITTVWSGGLWVLFLAPRISGISFPFPTICTIPGILPINFFSSSLPPSDQHFPRLHFLSPRTRI